MVTSSSVCHAATVLALIGGAILGGAARAVAQPDLPVSTLAHSDPSRQFAVGDRVPQSTTLDDDGFPDRKYGILIVDGATIFIIDRITRLIVQVTR
jgi:hypothetical protein